MSNGEPCFDLFIRLEQAMRAAEACWQQADRLEMALQGAGAAATGTCLGSATSGNPFPCAGTLSAYAMGLQAFLDFLNSCIALDLAALEAANAFEECAGQHKEYLNSKLQPKS
jgi:hypothetical protein